MSFQLGRNHHVVGDRINIPYLVMAARRWLLDQLYHLAVAAGGYANWMRSSCGFRFSIELTTVVGVLITMAGFWADRTARVENRVHQAWSLVAADHPGNRGLIEALEFLHGQDRNSLSSIKLPGVHLYGVKLPDAELNHVNFENAELSRAALTDVRLRDGKLRGARLHDADLTHADLTHADLTQATLNRAFLNDAIFDKTMLAGATLKDAKVDDLRLSSAWLCGTTLPDGSQSDRDCVVLTEECAGLDEQPDWVADRLRQSCVWLESRVKEPETTLGKL